MSRAIKITVFAQNRDEVEISAADPRKLVEVLEKLLPREFGISSDLTRTPATIDIFPPRDANP